jgi:putative intracellular protease/amidase
MNFSTTRLFILAGILAGLNFSCMRQQDQGEVDKLSSANNPPRVLFVLTSHSDLGDTGEETGFYLSEASHPWKELTSNGIHVDFISIKGGMPPVDGFKLEDPVNREFWENEEVQAALQNTGTPDAIDPSRYDAIHFVGGHGTMWDFPDNEPIAALASQIYENGGVVSAVCHGPAALVNIRLSDGSYLIDGKNLTGFTNGEETAAGLTDVVPFLLEDALVGRGAEFVAAANWQENVQLSGRLVTGQNPASASALGKELVRLLK